MSPALQAIAHPLREHGPVLLADVNDPHDEVLALVWGPRFDREHALWLWSRLSRRAPQQEGEAALAEVAPARRVQALEREARGDVGLLRLPVLRQREGIQIVPLFSERLLLARWMPEALLISVCRRLNSCSPSTGSLKVEGIQEPFAAWLR